MPLNPFEFPLGREAAGDDAAPDDDAGFRPQVIDGRKDGAHSAAAAPTATPGETPAMAAKKMIAEGLCGSAVAGDKALGDLVARLAKGLGAPRPAPAPKPAADKPAPKADDGGVIDMAGAVDDRLAETLIDMMRDDPADEQVA